MIFDCFMFFDELMLLEIRLKELNPVVDKFVLVEATHTHSGKPKRLYYDEVKDNEIFAPFKDKIVHCTYNFQADPTRYPTERDRRFANDRDQRNHIISGLVSARAEPDDLIIVSDLDEIVSRKAVELMKQYPEPGRLVMKLFYYYFNCRANQEWGYPASCRFRDFPGANKLRLEGVEKFTRVYVNAGWHFSYLFGLDDIPKKIEAFAHAEFDTDFYKDKARLLKCVEGLGDIFERPGMKFTVEPLDAPECVMNDRDKYGAFIK
jgi:beta-1,4-mannosyl-glycoprotein beta-1,4-N-acetylglucosaminyltransferase